jgi:hypothetical protein
VRAERVNGKPRHKFVLGLGSLKEPVEHEHDVIRFWVHAFYRMKRHGLDEHQRHHIANQMARKGAPLPTAEQCKNRFEGWQDDRDQVREIMRWLPAGSPVEPA